MIYIKKKQVIVFNIKEFQIMKMVYLLLDYNLHFKAKCLVVSLSCVHIMFY